MRISLNVSQKLIIGYLAILLFFIIIGYVGFLGTQIINENFNNIININAPILVTLGGIKATGFKMETAIIKYIYEEDDNRKLEQFKEIKESRNNLDLLMENYRVLAEKTKDKDEVLSINKINKSSEDLYKVFLAGTSVINSEEKLKLINEINKKQDNFEEIINIIIAGKKELFRNQDINVKNAVSKQIFITINLFIVVVFISIFIFILIYRSISLPIKKLYDGIVIVEGGNLSYKVGTKSKDEIGELSRAFDKMTVAIKKSRAEVDKKVRDQTKDIRKQKTALEMQNKKISNFLKVVEDEKNKLAHEKDKIDAILYSIGDGVFVVDKNYKIIVFNQVAADISGHTIGEAIGKKYNRILKFVYEGKDKINDTFIKEAIKTGEAKEMSNHTELIRKDGSRVAVADSAAPLKDLKGDVVGCVVVFRNVTKEREIDKAKTEFVSLASHQLRTPLSAINWYSEMLLAGDAGKLNKEQKDYLEEVYRGNQRMVELVNALLNVSRLELGTFMVEPKLVDITKIVKEVYEEAAHKIKKKKIKFTTKYDKNLGKLMLDERLTFMIFQNLLSNAIKYTPEGGKVSLNIKKNKEDIEIIFTDTGMGIPKEQQKKIFTKLFRADNVKESDTEGTGLGLYIVRSILDQSGGKIWFKSPVRQPARQRIRSQAKSGGSPDGSRRLAGGEENKGTEFHITIPLSGMKKREGTKELS